MTPQHKSPHSFNFRASLAFGEQYFASHRRYKSEPLLLGALLGPRHAGAFTPFNEERRIDILPGLLAPATLRLKPQYSIRRPRPNTEYFGSSCSTSPEIVLGEPKEPIGHPKTRIGQPVLKLAAIKERMDLLEVANDRLKQRIESYRTDAEMLSSSVTYFSSEYYAGLLIIRDLRTRSQKDAETINTQGQQLCQLKKFVGLMVEIGLHEPVLERAHKSVLAGKNFEPALVESIRNAAARRGSAWSGILSAVNAPPVSTLAVPDVFEDRQSNVDDLLKSLKNGDIPSGRHRSASQRFTLPVNRSPRSTSKATLRGKSPKTSLSPRSPARSVLGKIDVNRSPRKAGDASKPLPPRAPSAFATPAAPAHSNCDTVFSTQRALVSLQRISGDFSSGSIGSLGTTTEGSQSVCDASWTAAATSTPARSVANAKTSIISSTTAVAKSPPLRVCVRPPTACSVTTTITSVPPKRSGIPAASPVRRTRHLTAVPSPGKKSERGRTLVSPAQSRRCRPASDLGTPVASVDQAKKGKGWR
ncbi:hypothetical protein C8R43DRAFT_1241472 [Mycena crocata]|nr:hypothetical protein C8R43DRAFT_1241472 [Mycena crocata]